MCGIAGFFGARPVAPELPDRMLDEIRRRGPDARHSVTWDAGFGRDGAEVTSALMHARLSIIDPRPEADQPMSDASGRVWLCYNGEVYDWQGMADELRARGVVFRTRSDTEFILQAYLAWGIDGCLARLRGMFAFALLDLRHGKVFLARDRMGLKPLVYHAGDGSLAFGSITRAVLPFVPRHLRGFSPAGIDAYLAHRYVPAPGTIFQHIRRLENGHYLTYDLASGRLDNTCYWQPRAVAAPWAPELDRAILMRTVADRPLGLFLSGGVDSSVLAARLATLGHASLHSFTAAFDDPGMDESAQARAFAQRLGMSNLPVTMNMPLEQDFGRIVADLDEPFADPSSIPTWYLARETTRHVKVVLGGDGGDELFAGYKRYAKHLRTGWRRRVRLAPAASADLQPGRWARLRLEIGMDWRAAYSLRFSGLTPPQRRSLQPSLDDMQQVYWRMAPDSEVDGLATLLDIDMRNYLPEYVLRKADLCTMAHGLELRAPLLDHEFYQTILAVPDTARFTQPAKMLLRDVCTPCEEAGIFTRKKRGFNPPLRGWLQNDLAARLPGLGARLARITGGQLDAAAADDLVSRYRGGAEQWAEQVLQLLILDESLHQLGALAATP